MNQSFFPILIALVFTATQLSSADVVPSTLSVNFEGLPHQQVTTSLIRNLFENCIFLDPNDGSPIQDRNNVGNGVMRISFPSGLWGIGNTSPTIGSGLITQIKLQPKASFDFAFRVFFEHGFDFGQTPTLQEGKLNGLGGGSKPSGGTLPDGKGFTCRFNWRESGIAGQARLKLYVYYLSQAHRIPGSAWGDNFDLGINLVPGNWYTLRMRVTINSTTGCGQVATWADGLATPLQPTTCNDVPWVNPGIGIDTLLLETFFGGSASGYAPAVTSALQLDEIQVGQSFVGPEIITQPADALVVAGQAAVFTSAMSGNPTPALQWQRNGIDIAGATAATYTTPSTALSDNGAIYHCQAHNGAGSVTTRDAVLRFSAAIVAPSFISQPSDTSTTIGQSATFTVAVIGSPAPVFQWQRNGVDIPAATAANYTTSAITIADDGVIFHCVATNIAGRTTSVAARLTVSASAMPADQPTSGGGRCGAGLVTVIFLAFINFDGRRGRSMLQ